MTIELSAVAEALGVEFAGSSARIASWSIDSRSIEPGALFFAIRGERFDGHDFLDEVFAKGAAAAVVDRDVERGRVLRVRDTLVALQDLAAWARRRWAGQVIAVTGSAGKTTSKDVIADLLAAEIPTGRNSGNLNNHLGLPVSILRLPDQSRAAVFEMGMNHAGEIRKLAGIAHPDIGVITNVGSAHIENFDSHEGVAHAKRELIEELPRTGHAVLNADDSVVLGFRDVFPGRTITFGMSENADVRAEDVGLSLSGSRFRIGGVRFETGLIGGHGVRNVLAGVAVSQVFGIAPERLVEPVRALKPGRMRGERMEHRGITIWNDCYNSNPEAARAMIDVLRMTPARRHIAVLGEMLELGRWAETLHRDVGRYAAESGIPVLVGIRGTARQMLDEAVQSGLAADAAYFFEDPATAGQFLRQYAREGDAILFKGSRGTEVEKALEAFLS